MDRTKHLTAVDFETRKQITCCSESSIVVQGPPGSGKSALMEDIAKVYKSQNIVYMTLNSTLAKSSADKYSHLKNVSCCTLDSVNYAAAKQILGNFEMLQDERLKTYQTRALEKWAANDEDCDDMDKIPYVDIFIDIINGNKDVQRKHFTWPILRKLVLSTTILSDICTGRLQPWHTANDESNRKAKELYDSHIVFVDEAQDLGLISTELIVRHVLPHKRIYWLGDKYQSIYGQTQDIFCRNNTTEFKLRKSFRLPVQLSDVLRYMGSDIYAGNEQKTSFNVKMASVSNLGCEEDDEEILYLFHTNKSMWSHVIRSNLYNQTFRMNDFEKKAGDLIAEAVEMEEHGPRPKKRRVEEIFPSASTADDVRNIIDGIRLRQSKSAKLTIGTVHAFKGAECRKWIISNDIFQNVLKSRGPKSRRLALNILNVALSRGDTTLYLEDGIGHELYVLISCMMYLPLDVRRYISEFSPFL